MILKRYFILFMALVGCAIANAQTSYTISGNVTNQLSGLPMAATSVFAQNTTIGTVTDKDGNFNLQLPAGGYDLVISFTGFKTESKRISAADAGTKMVVKLQEKEKELETISITASNEVRDGLQKYGQFFKDEFIGKSINSKQCSIENPEVLHFFFSKKKNRLKITATDPLIIKNNALGYIIKYALDSFTHEYKNEVSVYTGYPLFENMLADSAQLTIWANARLNAYKGSMLHFMRSIYTKDLKAQQFEIQFIVQQAGKDESLTLKDQYAAVNYSKDDSLQIVEILPNQSNVGVLFLAEKPSAAYLAENAGDPTDFKFSLLNFRPQQSIFIEQNGYFYDQNDVSISGYWAWDKMAEQLPYDFNANIGL